MWWLEGFLVVDTRRGFIFLMFSLLYEGNFLSYTFLIDKKDFFFLLINKICRGCSKDLLIGILDRCGGWRGF